MDCEKEVEEAIDREYPFLRSYDFFDDLYKQIVEEIFVLIRNSPRGKLSVFAKQAMKNCIEKIDIEKVCENTDISVVNMMNFLASLTLYEPQKTIPKEPKEP